MVTQGYTRRAFRAAGTAVAVALCAAGVWGAKAGESGRTRLEQAVTQWMGLRAELAAEREAWDAARTHLERERAILASEKAGLEAELALLETRLGAGDSAYRETVVSRDRLRDALEDVAQAVREAAEAWRELKALFPDIDLDVKAAGDGASRAPRAADAVAAGLGEVVDGLSAIERLQHRCRVERRLIDIGARERIEAPVLLAGMTRAFAVSDDGRWAGVGAFTGGRWQWSARPELAGAIRRALQSCRDRTRPRIVVLPLAISGEGEARPAAGTTAAPAGRGGAP